MMLFILAVVWAAVLVSWLRDRTENRGVDSISSFSRHLSVLERTTPGGRQRARHAASVGTLASTPYRAAPVVRRPSRSAAKKRRKDILTGLLVATGVTALAAVVLGGSFTLLFVLSLLLTVGYVGLLAAAQKRVLEQRAKVRYLGTGAPVRTPVAAVPQWDDAAWTDEDWQGDEAADGTYGYGYPAPGAPTYATGRR